MGFGGYTTLEATRRLQRYKTLRIFSNAPRSTVYSPTESKRLNSETFYIRQLGLNASNISMLIHRNDWNRVAALFSAEDYEAVIKDILIWRERVPALPVGVEATLFLFQALLYDDNEPDPAKNISCEEQARSLYSLAVIR